MKTITYILKTHVSEMMASLFIQKDKVLLLALPTEKEYILKSELKNPDNFMAARCTELFPDVREVLNYETQEVTKVLKENLEYKNYFSHEGKLYKGTHEDYIYQQAFGEYLSPFDLNEIKPHKVPKDYTYSKNPKVNQILKDSLVTLEELSTGLVQNVNDSLSALARVVNYQGHTKVLITKNKTKAHKIRILPFKSSDSHLQENYRMIDISSLSNIPKKTNHLGDGLLQEVAKRLYSLSYSKRESPARRNS